MGQSAEPLPEKRLDGLHAEAVADRLKRFRRVAGQEAVVEGLIPDSLMLELSLGPLVSVDPDTHRERNVGGELDEAESEVPVEDVEVVRVHVHRAPVEGVAGRLPESPRLTSVLLVAAKGGDRLLCDADQHHALLTLELLALLLRDQLLAVALLEGHDRNCLRLGEPVDLAKEVVGEPLDQHRRDDRTAAVLMEKPPEVLGPL